VLVGHLPHLSRLASLLLVDDPGREIVAFRMGGIVCCGHGEGRWRLKWMLTPELIP
jgi:phosphohistidine phosphatase